MPPRNKSAYLKYMSDKIKKKKTKKVKKLKPKEKGKDPAALKSKIDKGGPHFKRTLTNQRASEKDKVRSKIN
tara:strand:+ start:419 stop:634 length:216 start_codon:yes stop_codon:yes gene_type:complete